MLVYLRAGSDPPPLSPQYAPSPSSYSYPSHLLYCQVVKPSVPRMDRS